jgi:hypothetical protein
LYEWIRFIVLAGIRDAKYWHLKLKNAGTKDLGQTCASKGVRPLAEQLQELGDTGGWTFVSVK